MFQPPFVNIIDPTSSRLRAVDNGLVIFLGKRRHGPNQFSENQIPVYYTDENGTTQQLSQPIQLNATGVPVLSKSSGTVINPIFYADVVSIVIQYKSGKNCYADKNYPALSDYFTHLFSVAGYSYQGQWLPNIQIPAKADRIDGYALWEPTNGRIVYPVNDNLFPTGSTFQEDLINKKFSFYSYKNLKVINVKDFGAAGDGVTDDTVYIDSANEEALKSGQNLFFPKGHYIYNGTGIKTDHYIQVYGEGSSSIIDAGSNTNAGFMVTMEGNRARIHNLELRGNPSNSNLRGVKFTLNQEDSGAHRLVFQDWHYGLEINRLWYCGFSDISFRNSAGVTLTGSHINIGDSDTTAEVNNILFERIYLLGTQDKGVTVNCYTQNLTWSACAFECSGTRYQFTTTRKPNTTTFNGCYIEGTSTSNAIIAHSMHEMIKVSLNDCLIRLDGTQDLSVMFDNVHGFLEACHGGSPNVLLSSATGRVTYIDDNTVSTRDNFYVLQGGSWNNSKQETNFEKLTATPKRYGASEFNAIIPKFVHLKTIAKGASEQSIFAIYLPADDSNQRKIRLDLNVTLQATTATPNVGQDKWTLLFYKGGGIGDGSTLGHQALLVSQGGNYVNSSSVTLTQLGYNSVTDSTKYLISYSPTTDVYDIECFFEIEGTFHNSSSAETRSWPWRIEKI